jgi:hypothetical protein
MRYNGELLEYFDQRSVSPTAHSSLPLFGVIFSFELIHVYRLRAQKPRAQRIETYYGIEEKLFIHMQENKRFGWFAMPKDGVGEDGKSSASCLEARLQILAARFRPQPLVINHTDFT